MVGVYLKVKSTASLILILQAIVQHLFKKGRFKAANEFAQVSIIVIHSFS